MDVNLVMFGLPALLQWWYGWYVADDDDLMNIEEDEWVIIYSELCTEFLCINVWVWRAYIFEGKLVEGQYALMVIDGTGVD